MKYALPTVAKIKRFLQKFADKFSADYLGSRALGSAYGAAGSLIALLAWIYYSSLIIFVEAQVSSLLNPRRPASANGTSSPAA